MKYIDADRLRARIEKELVFDNSIDTNYYIGRRDAEWHILTLIDSLKQEQPHWEPSEEQMTELFNALIPGAEYDCDILQELYFGLKSWLDSIHNQQK